MPDALLAGELHHYVFLCDPDAGLGPGVQAQRVQRDTRPHALVLAP
jgi:hypothetical protein